MFYYNAKYRFGLPETSPEGIPGAIISASAMPAGQLLRRDLRKHPYLQHRLYDPQLYLAGLDPNVAEGSVANLASYRWFGQHGVPDYDSDTHGPIKNWKQTYRQQLLQSWPGTVPTDPAAMEERIRAAIQYQVELGCEAIILPGPLSTVAMQDFEAETRWIDIGLAICQEQETPLPIYATVAISDNVLRGVDPTEHPLLHTITNQIAARDRLHGAYIVLEQSNERGYVCTSRETLLALLLIVDDLVRGAKRQVLVNYVGMFGVVAIAAGASIWSSGYYLSQRRLALADFEDKFARALPRYFSRRLAGDIGLESDLATAFRAGLGDRVLTDTTASAALKKALQANSYPGAVPEWQFKFSNINAASGHYNEIAYTLSAYLSTLEATHRRDVVRRWLETAVELADDLKKMSLRQSHYTELLHQRVWLDTYDSWRKHAGI